MSFFLNQIFNPGSQCLCALVNLKSKIIYASCVNIWLWVEEERSRSFFFTDRVLVLGISKVLHLSYLVDQKICLWHWNKYRILVFSNFLSQLLCKNISFSWTFSAILNPYVLRSRFFSAFLLLYKKKKFCINISSF